MARVMSALKRLLIILSWLLGIPLVFYSLLYAAQDRALFAAPPMEPSKLAWARGLYPQAEVNLTTPEGVSLHGWLVLPATPGPHPLLLVFGGNGDEATSYLYYREELPEHAWLVINYRSYGLSGGEPSETAFYQDALMLYDWAAQHPALDATKIIPFGRSLGSGVAVYLAAQRPVQRVILVSPYDSLSAIVQRFYPYLPVSWLLKNPFVATNFAPQAKAPMLALLAADDILIPPTQSQRLIDVWGGPARGQVIADCDHNSVLTGLGFWEAVRTFLATP